MSDIENVINRALQQGDPEAIRQLAAHLEAARPEHVRAQADDRFNFREAAQEFLREFSDVASRPDYMQMMREYDVQLARDNPELTYRQRLRMVGETMRKWVDENENADECHRGSVIEQMRKGRRSDLPDMTEGFASY